MAIDSAPRIGDWYRNFGGEAFEVVALDDDDTLELQYSDGTLEEMDVETWQYLRPQPADPPEDWRGPMDISREDEQAGDLWTETDDWMSRLERIEQSLR